MHDQPYGLPDDVVEGMALSSEEARALEDAVRLAPEDVQGRLRLLGFYLLASVASADAAFLAARHVVWLILHVPETKVLGTALGVPMNEGLCADAGRIWRAHIEAQPRNIQVLIHAARFFSQLDRPFAEHLRYRLQNLDPLRFSDFSIDFDAPADPSPRRDEATIAELEDDVVHAESAAERAAPLVKLAARAWAAGDVETARAKAEAALDAAREATVGDDAHLAEVLLGLVALEEGDVTGARGRLISSTQVSRGAMLDSFGPDMTLAKRLLELGQRDAVMDYFERCRELWTMGHALIDAWSADVHEGRTPNFLGNCRFR